MIRKVNSTDSKRIAEIYNYYIRETVITFEEIEVNELEIQSRIEKVNAKYPWIVLEIENEIVGYAYAGVWRERVAYRYTVETAVYLDYNKLGKGYGKLLYIELLKRLKEINIHNVLGVITIPNPESISLHEKLGFKKVAHFKEVGYKFDQWLDVGFWEKIME